MAKDLLNSNEYHTFLVDIKNQIKLSQQKAFNAVNQEMILLYCNIGAMIDTQQKELGWGAKVIDKLSLDILTEFPNMSGFSTRNLKLMVQFYKEYANAKIVQLPVAQLENLNMQPIVAQIPWTHNIILIQKIKDKSLRYWYMEQILQNGWSKDILSLMIKSEVHKRTGNLVSNFNQTLPPFESDINVYIKFLNAEGINLSDVKTPLDYNKLTDGGAAENTRGMLAYYLAIFTLIDIYRNEVKAPLIIDTPNQHEQATKNYEKIFNLVMTKTDKDKQIIICAMNNEHLAEYSNEANIITLESNKLLDKSKYEKIKTIFDEIEKEG